VAEYKIIRVRIPETRRPVIGEIKLKFQRQGDENVDKWRRPSIGYKYTDKKEKKIFLIY
jgi:hypothetical protein